MARRKPSAGCIENVVYVAHDNLKHFLEKEFKRVEQKAEDTSHDLSKAKQAAEHLLKEVDKVAQCILHDFPDEIGKGDPKNGESAADVAVRLLTDLRVQNAVLLEALSTIKQHYGQVCTTFEICKHPACMASSGSWQLADEALHKLEEMSTWKKPPTQKRPKKR